ncbi:uncharacterized protein LOC112547435 isoform X2 [Pelodiscus sinensis]|uniref:uncharacterized protein LOC112547435 isoform X2 n=1 Tax=Pelodiscus sinensis TaxID=13735 RepID=UPI003F6ABB9F
MGETKGSWKQCFCCAGPPQTKSSISINISNAEPEDLPEEAEEIKQQITDGPFYTEVQVQTSYVEIPPGEKWRWSRLQTEAQVQTSDIELTEETFLPFESEVQVQTSDLETSEEETSLPSLTDAQVQTSRIEVLDTEILFPIESEPLEQPSDLDFQDIQVKNLFPLFVEVEVQTSYVDIPAGNKWRSARLQADAQVQTSDHELLKTLSSLSQKEAQVQTSKLSVDETEEVPSQAEAQVQTSALELTEVEEAVPSLIEEQPVPTTQSEAAVQTSYVDIPAGNNWRSSRLQVEAQVQTSSIELLKKLSSTLLTKAQVQKSDLAVTEQVPLSASVAEAQVQTSKLEVTGAEGVPLSPSLTDAQVQTSKLVLVEVEEEAAPCPIEEVSLPVTVAEAAVQTSYVDIPAGNKWRSSRLQAEAQVQTSRIELLQKLSSLSLTKAQVQTSKLALAEAEPVPLSPSLTEAQVQTSELALVEAEEEEEATFPIEEDSLPVTVAEAAVQTSYIDIPAGNKWRSSRLQAEAQVQTSRIELLKKLSSLSLTEVQVQTSKLEVTGAEEVPRLPSLTEAQVQTSKLAITEAEEEEEATFPIEEDSLPVTVAEAAVQTSYIDIPAGNKWRSARLQAEAQVQTSRIELLKKLSSPSVTEVHVQTSKLEVTGAEEVPRLPSLTEVQVQTSKLEVTGAEEVPRLPSLTEAQVQTSELAVTEVEEEEVPFPIEEVSLPVTVAEAAVQTSYVDLPAGNKWRSSRLQVEAQVQTSRVELLKKLSSLSLTEVQVQTSKLEVTGAEEVPRLPSLTEAQVQTSKLALAEAEQVPLSPSLTEAQVQTSKLAITEVEEEMAPFPKEETPLTITVAEAAVQTSYVDLPAGSKWRSSRLQAEAQVQTSSIELLKKLSSPSVTNVQVQTSKLEVTGPEKVPLPPSLTEAQVQTSKLAVTEAETAFPVPSQTEVHMQSSYFEAPEVEDEMPATPIKERPLPLTLMAAQTQTSYVDIPAGNKWRSSRLKVEAQVQTSKLELPEAKEKSPSPSPKQAKIQTSRVEITKAKAVPLTPPDVKIVDERTLKEEVEVKHPPSEYVEAQVQTSYVEIPVGKKWRSSRLCTETQVQTSYHELPVTKSKTLPPKATGVAKKATERTSSKKLAKTPTRATPISVHLHVKMTPRRRNANKKN